MKKAFIAVAVLSLFASAAQATNLFGDTTNNNQTYNQPQSNATANGGQGGTGVGIGIAGAASAAEAKANAAAIAAQQQGQQQGQAQGQQQSSNSTSGVKNSGNSASVSGAAVVGSGNSGGNKLQGNKTSVSVGGDKYEAAASGVFAAPIPTVATSCRLYMFGGGTNVSGAVSGSIPLGNDQTCLSGVNLNNMLRVNQQAPGTFTIADMVTEACKVEGMETAAPCKDAAK